MASIAFEKPVPAVDGNVLRVLARLLACPEDIANTQVKKKFRRWAQQLMDHCHSPSVLTQSLMELGATVCLPNTVPRCAECPVQEFCLAKAQANPTAYPFKSGKKPRRVEKKTVFLLVAQDRVLLHKRPDKGLLAGLWEFPNISGWAGEDSRLFHEFLEELGVNPLQVEQLPQAKHIFSHVEWQMQGLLVRCTFSPAREGYVWANSLELDQAYAVPGAFQAYRGALKSVLP